MALWLLLLSTVIAPNAQQQDAAVAQSRQVMDVTPEPVVCVSTPHRSLTINRAGGWTNIYVSVRSSRAPTSPVGVTISVSAPANPSGVQLEAGGKGLAKKVRVDPGKEVKDVPLLLVQTGKTNQYSGHLLYLISAALDASQRETVNVTGVPLEVDVQTVP